MTPGKIADIPLIHARARITMYRFFLFHPQRHPVSADRLQARAGFTFVFFLSFSHGYSNDLSLSTKDVPFPLATIAIQDGTVSASGYHRQNGPWTEVSSEENTPIFAQ